MLEQVCSFTDFSKRKIKNLKLDPCSKRKTTDRFKEGLDLGRTLKLL